MSGRADPAEIVVSIVTFTYNDPAGGRGFGVVNAGDRFRVDDPVVKLYPDSFMPEGLPSSEYRRGRAAIVARKEEANRAWQEKVAAKAGQA